MAESEVPFYTKAAILDRYIKSANPAADRETLEIIIGALQSKAELRDYFFRSRPHPAWAPILWDYGFFKAPPDPVRTGNEYALPRWDAQEYLISIAEHSPDVVVKHVQELEGHAYYKGRAVEAVRFLRTEDAAAAMRRILHWLSDEPTGAAIADNVYELMKDWAKEGRPASIDLFRALTAPFPPKNKKEVAGSIFGAEASSILRRAILHDRIEEETLKLLHQIDIKSVASILEEHLLSALRIEAEAKNFPEFEFTGSSWWRSAIEETGQDIHDDFKDILLEGLRDTLEAWARTDVTAVSHVLERYADERHEILRRLRLHVIRKFPSLFRAEVSSELLDAGNYDETGLHHEVFMLLREGYPHLDEQDRRRVLDLILQGPPEESVRKMADWAHQERGVDRDEYIRGYTRAWIRDRLVMIRDHLHGEPSDLFKELIDEMGVPEHPDFTHWTSGAYFVSDVSPVSAEYLSSMPAGDLLAFLRQWHPDPHRQLGPERVSYRGLARVVSQVVLSDMQKYRDNLTAISTLHPEFPYAIFNQATSGETVDARVWDSLIELSENLLADAKVREDINRIYEIDWVEVRRLIVNFLEAAVDTKKGPILPEYLPRVRDLLFILINDPDPGPESDRPPEGWFGHKDPAAVAINHVRSDALIGLINYSAHLAQIKPQGELHVSAEDVWPNRLEESVEAALTRKLNPREENSWAVHSVFGRELMTLYWLNRRWVELHIDDIFPEGEDVETAWRYVAAWDSYVVFNQRLYQSLFELLRPKYVKAIDNISKGFLTRTHLRPEEGLAAHLIGEYLRSDYDIRSHEGQESLLALFFAKAQPESRGKASWLLWRTCHDNPADAEAYWPKARSLWHWRVDVASSMNHPDDFGPEMEWFASLLEGAPRSETMVSLWPLLEGTLPYCARSEHRDLTWDALEAFLLREVERDPLRVVQFYHLMYEKAGRAIWSYQQKTRKILEVGAGRKEARKETLSLINLLARFGDHQYRDIYEQYDR